MRLFDRNSQGVELTNYGRALLECGVTVFDEMRQGLKRIEFLADPASGELRVGCPEITETWPALRWQNEMDRAAKGSRIQPERPSRFRTAPVIRSQRLPANGNASIRTGPIFLSVVRARAAAPGAAGS